MDESFLASILQHLEEMDRQYTFGFGEPDMVEIPYYRDANIKEYRDMQDEQKEEYCQETAEMINEELSHLNVEPDPDSYSYYFEDSYGACEYKIHPIIRDIIHFDLYNLEGKDLDEYDIKEILVREQETLINRLIDCSYLEIGNSSGITLIWEQIPSEDIHDVDWQPIENDNEDIIERLESIPEEDYDLIEENLVKDNDQGEFFYDIKNQRYKFMQYEKEIAMCVSFETTTEIVSEILMGADYVAPFENDPMFKKKVGISNDQ